MQVVVYICCDPEQRELGEKSVRLAWSDGLPADFISMGKAADWRIARNALYQTEEGPVTSVNIAYVYRGEIPPVSEWQFQKYADDYPEQAIEIRTGDLGSNFLGWVVLPQGDVPTIGEYLITYGMKPDSTKVVTTEPWFKTELQSFCGDGWPGQPFANVYLVHHQIQAVGCEAVGESTETGDGLKIGLGEQLAHS